MLCSHADNSAVVALCLNATGTHALAAHAQGPLMRCALQGPGNPTTLCTLPSPAVGIAWMAGGIVTACADGKVAVACVLWWVCFSCGGWGVCP